MVIILVIVVTANRDWIAKQFAEKQIRAATGLEPEIGGLSFGVWDPKLTLENFKLYNTADFGGTLFLDVPELHIEYDRAALQRHELHFTLVRVNFREADVVKNSAGATNFMTFFNAMLPQQPGGGGRSVAPLNGYKFTGIDLLNLSIGTVKFVDLKDQRRNRSVTFGLQNQIYTNVLSTANLTGLSAQLWVHNGASVGLPVSQPRPKPSPVTPPTTP